MTSALLLLLAAPVPAPAEKSPDGAGPVLVARGKDVLVHAVPRGGTLTRRKPKEGFPLLQQDVMGPSGLVLVHTSTDSGEAKTLLSTGSWSFDLATGVPRVCQGRSSLVGVVADRQRLYVAWHQSEMVVEGLPGQEQRELKTPDSYHLWVFRLLDGKLLHELDLKDGELPKKAPAEKADKGPLEVVDNGVRCFGLRFEFDGDRLTRKGK
jgi:hypothetical protein